MKHDFPQITMSLSIINPITTSSLLYNLQYFKYQVTNTMLKYSLGSPTLLSTCTSCNYSCSPIRLLHVTLARNYRTMPTNSPTYARMHLAKREEMVTFSGNSEAKKIGYLLKDYKQVIDAKSVRPVHVTPINYCR